MTSDETGSADADREQSLIASRPLPLGFEFVERPCEYRDPEALVVHVPAAARGKQKVLGVLASGLRFPSYFGWNWDALDECLRDLSWLAEVRKVAIVHDGVPFSPRAELFSLYCDLLAEAITAQRTALEPRELKVVFPASIADVFRS